MSGNQPNNKIPVPSPLESVGNVKVIVESPVLIEDILENLEYVKSEFEEIYEELGK